jgi:ABC-type Fe3+-siderophore transport system permease subunit
VKARPKTKDHNAEVRAEEERSPAWASAIALIVWLFAGAVAFLPFAVDTSPWDAVTLRVPGNQGNWWHFLAGAPFFLAFPMIWLRLRALFSNKLSSVVGRRALWSVIGLSTAGTILVLFPFLLHLAGTSEWQRLFVLTLVFGIVIASAVLLFLRRRHILPTRACLIGLNTAYLANAAVCLVVYADATGTTGSRSGWMVTRVIVWPIAFELVWLFIQTFRTQTSQINLRAT